MDVKSELVRDVFILRQSAENLASISQNFTEGKVGLDSLRREVIAVRLKFKKVEWLAEYLQPEIINRYINGPPLPKVDPVLPTVEVIPPAGLQTLDELVSSIPVDTLEVMRITTILAKATRDLEAQVVRSPIQYRYIFEASREELIRIFTLGLTGFDTPGDADAIQEAAVALHTLLRVFQKMNDDVKAVSHEHLILNITSLFEESMEYLDQSMESAALSGTSSFDILNRAVFYKNYLSPLYSMIYDLHKEIGVEFREEVDRTQTAVNIHTKEIFNENFLNPSFYAEVAESDLQDPKKINLGKILFFDPALSKDLTLSCASCHQPKKAFSDGSATSPPDSIRGDILRRNVPTLLNSVYSQKYFWDLREYDLERQVKHVVYNHAEFNMDFVELALRLKNSEEYLNLFENAYGDRDKYGISTWSISNALAAYVASLRSWDSPFDKYIRGEQKTIDPQVVRGFNLFMGKGSCGTCHFAPTFNGTVPPRYRESESEILGVTTTFDTISPTLDSDPGRYGNKVPRDEALHLLHSFKTVTVRNVELTAPYMHNGAFNTLEEVMHFYNKGGGAGLGLEVAFQTLPDTPLNLNQEEIEDIIVFMESLTDTAGMTSSPKKLPDFPDRPEWNTRGEAY